MPDGGECEGAEDHGRTAQPGRRVDGATALSALAGMVMPIPLRLRPSSTPLREALHFSYSLFAD